VNTSSATTSILHDATRELMPALTGKTVTGGVGLKLTPTSGEGAGEEPDLVACLNANSYAATLHQTSGGRQHVELEGARDASTTPSVLPRDRNAITTWSLPL
jgi:hypothetical protein